MNRQELEHIIRAAADVTGQPELIIIGSQAILGQFPNAPEPLLVSMEADIYAPNAPELSDFINGTLGPDSLFDKTHGYHADGVGPTTASLPSGWSERLIRICNPNPSLPSYEPRWVGLAGQIFVLLRVASERSLARDGCSS